MRTEIVQAWKDYSLFEMKLNEKIKAKEQYYEIIMFYGKLTHFSVVINVN